MPVERGAFFIESTFVLGNVFKTDILLPLLVVLLKFSWSCRLLSPLSFLLDNFQGKTQAIIFLVSSQNTIDLGIHECIREKKRSWKGLFANILLVFCFNFSRLKIEIPSPPPWPPLEFKYSVQGGLRPPGPPTPAEPSNFRDLRILLSGVWSNKDPDWS